MIKSEKKGGLKPALLYAGGKPAEAGKPALLRYRSAEALEVLQAGAGVEEHDGLVGADFFLGEELLHRGVAGGAFGGREHAFGRAEIFRAAQHLFVRHGNAAVAGGV